MFSKLHRMIAHPPIYMRDSDFTSGIDKGILNKSFAKELLRVLETPKHVNNGDAALFKEIKYRDNNDTICLIPADGFSDSYSCITLQVMPKEEIVDGVLMRDNGFANVVLMVESCAGLYMRFHRDTYNIVDPSASLIEAASDHGQYKLYTSFPVKYRLGDGSLLSIDYSYIKKIIDVVAHMIVMNIPSVDEREAERAMKAMGRADDS